MKKHIIGVLFLGTFLSLYSQDVLWQKDLKSPTQDFLQQVIITIDRQYLVTGSAIQKPKMTSASTEGGKKPNNGYDYHIVKLGQNGETLWENYFSGPNHDYLSAASPTQEGGFLLAGTSFSPKGQDKKEDSKGGSDIWVIKVSETGEEEWQQTLGTDRDDEARSVIQNTQLGYVIAGNTHHHKNGYGSTDVLVVQLDKTGKEVSRLILGGKGIDEVKSMIPTKDGGALLGIYSRSEAFTGTRSLVEDKLPSSNPVLNSSSSSPTIKPQYFPKITSHYGEGDFWLVKLNKDGKVEWQKTYGGTADDQIRTMALTTSGYIIGGESRSERSGNKSKGIEDGTDLWLIALDEKGDDQWQKTFSFGNRDVLMSLNVVSNAKDTESKGFLLGGYTPSEGRMRKNDETFWMLYLDGKGEEVWRKYVKGESRKKKERLMDLKMGRDGSIILAGTSAEELGKENWKIVRLADKQIEQLIEKQDIKIYPNPVSDYCYVEIGFEFKEAEILLYDMGGRQLESFKTRNQVTKINTQKLVQGAYLVVTKATLTDGKETKTANTKLIKN